MKHAIQEHLKTAQEILVQIRDDPRIIETIEQIVLAMVPAFRQGRKVLLMGNGGSAADAQHMAGEFIGRFKHERRPLPALALTTDTSILTAIGNDYSFELVFARQVQALATAGDVAIGISTSGKSRNVIEGLRYARQLGAITVGLTGKNGGPLTEVADFLVRVPSNDTPQIQEGLLVIEHTICELVEQALLSEYS